MHIYYKKLTTNITTKLVQFVQVKSGEQNMYSKCYV